MNNEIAPTITLTCKKCHNYYKVKEWDDEPLIFGVSFGKERTHCGKCGTKLIDERFA